MAETVVKSLCSMCNKEKNTYKCEGCSQSFCFNHLAEHRQTIGKQFDEIENDHDQFRQTIIQHKNNPKNHSLIEQVNQWEENSIKIIKQTAEQCRQTLIKLTNKIIIKLEDKLSDLAKKIKEIRRENEFNESDLKHLKKILTTLEEELNKPRTISIKKELTSFINKISVMTDTKWKQDGVTIVGENGYGDQLNQLYNPRNIFIDDDQTLYIADRGNDRILQRKANATNGRIFAGGFGKGNQMNQLNGPSDVIVDKENNSIIIADLCNRRVIRWSRENNTTNGEIIISDIDCRGLTMDKDGSLYVSDWKKNEVRRWKRGEKNGIIVAGGYGKGNQLNQLNNPNYIFVDEDYSLYISDQDNHRVMKWLKDANEGVVVAGGNGQGKNLTQLSQPQGIIVDLFDQIYVADWDNHRVMRWCEGEKEGTIVVGGKGVGNKSNQFANPQGLSFDREGNLYVVDCTNNRIQKFEIDFN